MLTSNVRSAYDATVGRQDCNHSGCVARDRPTPLLNGFTLTVQSLASLPEPSTAENIIREIGASE